MRWEKSARRTESHWCFQSSFGSAVAGSIRRGRCENLQFARGFAVLGVGLRMGGTVPRLRLRPVVLQMRRGVLREVLPNGSLCRRNRACRSSGGSWRSCRMGIRRTWRLRFGRKSSKGRKEQPKRLKWPRCVPEIVVCPRVPLVADLFEQRIASECLPLRIFKRSGKFATR